jgi:hypothetical protein
VDTLVLDDRPDKLAADIPMEADKESIVPVHSSCVASLDTLASGPYERPLHVLQTIRFHDRDDTLEPVDTLALDMSAVHTLADDTACN